MAEAARTTAEREQRAQGQARPEASAPALDEGALAAIETLAPSAAPGDPGSRQAAALRDPRLQGGGPVQRARIMRQLQRTLGNSQVEQALGQGHRHPHAPVAAQHSEILGSRTYAQGSPGTRRAIHREAGLVSDTQRREIEPGRKELPARVPLATAVRGRQSKSTVQRNIFSTIGDLAGRGLSGIRNLAGRGLAWASEQIVRPIKTLGSAYVNATKHLGSRVTEAAGKARPTYRDMFLPHYLFFRIAKSHRQRVFSDAIQEEGRYNARYAAQRGQTVGGDPVGPTPGSIERLDRGVRALEGGADAVFEANREIVEGAILGDFKKDPSFWNITGQIAMGFVPYAGQAADIRDLIASLKKIIFDGGYKDGWEWFNLALVLVGIVPGIGDAIKAVGRGSKGIIRRLGGQLFRRSRGLWVKAARRAKGLLRGASHYGRRLIEGVGRIGRRVLGFAEHMGRRVWQMAQRASQRVSGMLKALGSRIRGLLRGAVERVRIAIGRARGFLGRAVGAVIDMARRAFDSVRALLERSVTMVKRAVQRGAEIAKEIARSIVKKVHEAREFFRSFVRRGIERGRAMLRAARERVRLRVRQAVRNGRVLVERARRGAINLFRKGMHWVREKAIRWVAEQWSGLKHKVRDFLEKRWERLKERLGIKRVKSPDDWKPGQSLPNNKDSIIDRRKFEDYSMNPEANNRGKWQAFQEVGYKVDTEAGRKAATNDIISQLRRELESTPATRGKEVQFGARFEVRVQIQGPNGKKGTLVTVWQFDQGTTKPRLITNWLEVHK